MYSKEVLTKQVDAKPLNNTPIFLENTAQIITSTIAKNNPIEEINSTSLHWEPTHMLFYTNHYASQSWLKHMLEALCLTIMVKTYTTSIMPYNHGQHIYW